MKDPMITIPTNDQPLHWNHLQTMIEVLIEFPATIHNEREYPCPISLLIDYYGVMNIQLH